VWRENVKSWDYINDVPDDVSPIMDYAINTLGKSPGELCQSLSNIYHISVTTTLIALNYAYYEVARDWGLDWMHWIEIFRNDNLCEPGQWYHYSTVDLTGFVNGEGPRRHTGYQPVGLSGNIVYTNHIGQEYTEDLAFILLGGGSMLLCIGNNVLYSDDFGNTWDYIYTQEGNVITPWRRGGGAGSGSSSVFEVFEWEDHYGFAPLVQLDAGKGTQEAVISNDKYGQAGNLATGGFLADDPTGETFKALMYGELPASIDNRNIKAQVGIRGRIETENIICSTEAGFIIRALHINELRRKLQILNNTVQTGGTNHINFGIDVSDLPTVSANKTAVRRDHYHICKRETDGVIGQVALVPGGAYYCDIDLTEFSLLMPDPIVDEEVSIRTLIGMRKTLQALYSDGWFCACFSYCPCQTHFTISGEGSKK
jgi:hypothetical protein